MDRPILDLKKLFWYWINERHRVYLKKEAGDPKPWTEDPILQEYKFTNVFRELDTVTKYCAAHIRTAFTGPELLFALSIFRQTGTVDAGGILLTCPLPFEYERWRDYWYAKQCEGLQVYTGAYIVTAQFPGAKGLPKIYPQFKQCIEPIWENRQYLYDVCRETKSIEAFTNAISQYKGWGGSKFMSYEVACDLRYTPILEDATDKMTWANPGPGAQRGLCRMNGEEPGIRPKARCLDEMRSLLEQAPRHLEDHVPALEMREIEHSLCEFDKYVRVFYREGRPRSRYNGKG